MICLKFGGTCIFNQHKAATKTGDILKNAFLASDHQASPNYHTGGSHDLANLVLLCNMAELAC